MNTKKFKQVLGRGIMLAIPLAIVLYVFGRIIGIFSKVIEPLAAKMGIQRIWGELTLTVFAIILIIMIVLLLGLLMQIAVVSTIKTEVEDIILKFIPSLNQLNLMAADNLDLDSSEISWRPVLFYTKEKAKYNPAFVVEEDDQWVTLFVCYETSIRKGEISIINKEKISIIPITYNQLHKCSRAAGKGYIEIINDYNKKGKKQDIQAK